MPPSHFYEFGEFRLDPQQRLLFRHGELVPLAPKAFDTLLLLVENHGRVLDKDTLLTRVWLGTFVEEGSLARNVSVVRKALGGSADGDEFIETIPKRGYRFVAMVQETSESQSSEAKVAPGPDVLPSGVATVIQRHRSFRFAAPVAALAIFLFLIAGYFVVRRNWHSPDPPPARIMLAVLPFANLTGDPAEEYVCDGLTEETISQLGNLNPKQLGVIARTSSMAYKNTTKTIDQIGRELGVDYVLEGSVRGTVPQMRFTAQLVRVRDQTHLWSHEYDRVARNVLSVQTDISQAVADAVDVSLSPQPGPASARAAVHSEVYDLYLQGRFHWNKRSREELVRAVDYFQQAIAKDPNYAPAYAGLADCFFLQMWISDLPIHKMLSLGEVAAQRAIELDPGLAEPHASLGIIAMAELDWPLSERELERALDLNSNYATAHHWNGMRLAAIGRQQDGVAELKRAIELDPLAPILHTELGWLQTLARNPEAGVLSLNKALELDPNFYLAYEYRARAYELQRNYPVALADMQKALELSNGKPELKARLARIYGLEGKTDEARNVLPDLAKQPSGQAAILSALVYSGLNDKQNELAMLERACAESNTEASWFKVDPIYDPIRADARFQQILRRSGLQ